MTEPKPKVIHVIVPAELHKQIVDARAVAGKTIGLVGPLSTSETVRWLLQVGLRAVGGKRG